MYMLQVIYVMCVCAMCNYYTRKYRLTVYRLTTHDAHVCVRKRACMCARAYVCTDYLRPVRSRARANNRCCCVWEKSARVCVCVKGNSKPWLIHMYTHTHTRTYLCLKLFNRFARYEQRIALFIGFCLFQNITDKMNDVHVCMRVCAYVCVHVCVWVWCVCVCVCVCLHWCVCTCVFTHTNPFGFLLKVIPLLLDAFHVISIS